MEVPLAKPDPAPGRRWNAWEIASIRAVAAHGKSRPTTELDPVRIPAKQLGSTRSTETLYLDFVERQEWRIMQS